MAHETPSRMEAVARHPWTSEEGWAWKADPGKGCELGRRRKTTALRSMAFFPGEAAEADRRVRTESRPGPAPEPRE